MKTYFNIMDTTKKVGNYYRFFANTNSISVSQIFFNRGTINHHFKKLIDTLKLKEYFILILVVNAKALENYQVG